MESHYLISECQIDANCAAVKSAFSCVSFKPAYSVKTNHVPHIVKRFHENGFLVEVVSDMEVEIARAVGVPYHDIIYNGPMKGELAVDVAEGGGVVVFDNELDFERFPSACRCMFRVAANIDNGVDTRFGIPPKHVFNTVSEAVGAGFDVVGIHCHVTKGRSLEAWGQKLKVMADVYAQVKPLLSERIVDMGGNMYSNIPESMAESFPENVTYEQYAILFDLHRGLFDGATFILEMGTSVVSDCMSYKTEVLGIKTTAENTFILLNTSHYSLGWRSQHINHPMSVKRGSNRLTMAEIVHDAKFVGRLCTEDDVMHRGYSGPIAVGDEVTFENVGSYTVVVKPPFIIPQDPIYYVRSNGEKLLAKRREQASDVLATYQIGE